MNRWIYERDRREEEINNKEYHMVEEGEMTITVRYEIIERGDRSKFKKGGNWWRERKKILKNRESFEKNKYIIINEDNERKLKEIINQEKKDVLYSVEVSKKEVKNINIFIIQFSSSLSLSNIILYWWIMNEVRID